MIKRRGITIVEILIAVAIIGVIVVAGFGFNFFVDSYNMGRESKRTQLPVPVVTG